MTEFNPQGFRDGAANEIYPAGFWDQGAAAGFRRGVWLGER
jgi:hypothetical protein